MKTEELKKVECPKCGEKVSVKKINCLDCSDNALDCNCHGCGGTWMPCCEQVQFEKDCDDFRLKARGLKGKENE